LGPYGDNLVGFRKEHSRYIDVIKDVYDGEVTVVRTIGG